MPGPEVLIERVMEVSDELVEAFGRLVPQLSSAAPPDHANAGRILANPATVFLTARELDGRIIGMLTLVTFVIPSGTRAIIEDVVVDETARRRGIAASLVDEALQFAIAAGARNVDLTSRPSRVEANHLYERAGFVKRSTNVWRYSFG